MSLLFFIDERNNHVLRPDCVKLCPELAGLKDKEVYFIILAYDNHSPLRQFPEHDRIRKAMFQSFGDNIPEMLDKTSIKLAIGAYKSLQYDPKIELAKRYQAKIDRMLELLDEDDNPTSIAKTTTAIDGLRKNIIGLEQEVAESVLNKGVIKGDMELSFIEDIMQSQKYYKSVTSKK